MLFLSPLPLLIINGLLLVTTMAVDILYAISVVVVVACLCILLVTTAVVDFPYPIPIAVIIACHYLYSSPRDC